MSVSTKSLPSIKIQLPPRREEAAAPHERYGIVYKKGNEAQLLQLKLRRNSRQAESNYSAGVWPGRWS